ncbi:hypothetical protein GCM10010172_50900 [Paractinoplanes ferrugineus]|uniref:Uncharacterized protein n=1 Tax=Paractinoplanes ferrugineus TaxID=113564 RepID=A0A919JA39_9ACTN|nr:restriction endonuclease fold toxin-2 domain-containing protein [Actinoplanes ferrugineus]GIE16092.1 hypothetical protein Afe05nite_79320 [Actinoplanes ferrugineus]
MLADPGGGGGFGMDRDVMFRAAVDMVATKDYTYAIESGLAGDLHVSAGMAGDDSTAHSFAAKYEPAARTIVTGVGNSGQAIGVTASKLLATAVDFLAADQRAAGRLAPHVDTQGFAAPPSPDCEPQNAAAALPMVTGSKEVHEIPVIGRFWPQGNPDDLRATADVWARAADRIDDAQRNAEKHAAPVPVHCSGDTIAAFNTYVRRIWAADPAGGTTVDAGQPLMENLSSACRQMQRMCDQYADAIDDCRTTLIAIGVGAGIITVAGVLLTVFTFGGSDAAAAAGDAALVAEAAAAADALAVAEAELAAAAAVAEAEAVLTSTLAKLAATGALTVAVVGATADSASAQGPELSGVPLAMPATVPPLPPIPPSGVFPPYSAQDQAAAAAWAAGLPTRDPNYGTPDDRAYQVRVAGQPERRVYGADGSSQWADGYRSTDGALVDAKHVRDPSCTPRTLQGLAEEQFATKFTVVKDEKEVRDYGSAIANPANHAQYLEIDTDDEVTLSYWQFLTAGNDVPSDVRYVP